MAFKCTLLWLAIVLWLLLSDLFSTRMLEAQGPDRGMIVAAWTDAISFHPFQTTDTASSGYQGLVYERGLIERDPQDIGRFIGNLAERWTVSDDHLTYTFTLRP